MNKIVNGVANDYEFPQLDWVHYYSTTIKIPSDEETTNLAKAICDYFPLLVEENKRLQQELQIKDNIINELKEKINQFTLIIGYYDYNDEGNDEIGENNNLQEELLNIINLDKIKDIENGNK